MMTADALRCGRAGTREAVAGRTREGAGRGWRARRWQGARARLRRRRARLRREDTGCGDDARGGGGEGARGCGADERGCGERTRDGGMTRGAVAGRAREAAAPTSEAAARGHGMWG